MELKGRELVTTAGQGSSGSDGPRQWRAWQGNAGSDGRNGSPGGDNGGLYGGDRRSVKNSNYTLDYDTATDVKEPITSNSNPRPGEEEQQREEDGTHRGEDSVGGSRLSSLWQSLQSLRRRMSAADPEQLDPNLEPHTNTDTRQPTPLAEQPASTTTTSTTSTTKDILSTNNGCRKELLPTMARKIAKAAALTVALMSPVKDLMASIEVKYDLVEIACSGTSTLTKTFEDANYQCYRVNQLNGYNLDTKKGTTQLKNHLEKNPARLAWVSMPWNLTPRDDEQWAKFLKRRGQDLRRDDEVAESLDSTLRNGGDVAWEWPLTAVAGWKSKAIRRLERLAKKYGRVLYTIRIDGCQYGLEWKGVPLRKGMEDSHYISAVVAFNGSTMSRRS